MLLSSKAKRLDRPNLNPHKKENILCREIVLGDWVSFPYVVLIEGCYRTFLGHLIFGLRVGLLYLPVS